jgi:DUF2933 family protein
VNTSNLGLFAIAAAIAFVGTLWAGIQLTGLATLLVVLACPLMMIFMMRDMHGGGSGDKHDRDQHLHP